MASHFGGVAVVERPGDRPANDGDAMQREVVAEQAEAEQVADDLA